MDKEKFLWQLEKLLYDIPKEERDEALEYYRSYFEEAGEENEAKVLEELGDVQGIASSIKEGLGAGAGREEYLKYPPQPRNKKVQDGASSGQKYRQYGNYKKYDEKEKSTKWILLILAAVITLPLWGSVASLLLGVAGTCIAVLIGLGLFSIGGLVGGIICIVAGVVRLCTAAFAWAQGVIWLGVGLLLIAGSGFSIVALALLCGKFLPWAVRKITDLGHKLADWYRRSLA